MARSCVLLFLDCKRKVGGGSCKICMLLTSLKALWKFYYEVELWLGFQFIVELIDCEIFSQQCKVAPTNSQNDSQVADETKIWEILPASPYHQNNSSKKHATRILIFRCAKFWHEIEIEAGNFSRKFSFIQFLSWLVTYALIFHRHDLWIISRYLTPTMLQIFFYLFRSVVVDMFYKIVYAHKSQLTNQHKRMKNVVLLSARHWMSHLLPK